MFWMSCGVTFGGPSTDGMTSSSAPSARISWKRSSVKQSAMTMSALYPFARQTSASAGPVLPPVYSTTVSPGEIRPSPSALSIIARAIRSFIAPVGLRSASLSHNSAPFRGAQRRTRTTGVFPIASRIESIRALGDVWRFHQQFIAYGALHRMLPEPAPLLHSVGVRIEGFVLALVGGEIGVVGLPDDLVCRTERGRPQRQRGEPDLLSERHDVLRDLQVFAELSVENLLANAMAIHACLPFCRPDPQSSPISLSQAAPLRIDGLAAGEHRHELLDLARTGLSPSCGCDPVQDGVAL